MVFTRLRYLVQTKTHGGWQKACASQPAKIRRPRYRKRQTRRRTIMRYNASRITAPRMDISHPAV